MCVFKTAMSHSQTWTLSEAAGKRSGTCKVCLAVRQLHNKDGTVHKHGPRDNPCPGSHQPPLSGSEHSQITQAAACNSAALSPSLLLYRSTTESTNQANSFNEPHTAIQSSQSPGKFPFWALSGCPMIKHIPKAARFVCATHLAGLLRKVADNPANLKAWKNVLTWSCRVLGSLKRGGKRHKTASIVKQRVVDFDNRACKSRAAIFRFGTSGRMYIIARMFTCIGCGLCRGEVADKNALLFAFGCNHEAGRTI